MATIQCSRSVLLALSMAQVFTCGGILLGWPALRRLLDSSRMFDELCATPTVPAAAADLQTCEVRIEHINTIYSVGMASMLCASLFTGALLDTLGMKRTMLICNVGIMAGCALLALSFARAFDGLLLSMLFLGLFGPGMQQGASKLALLFPQSQALVVGSLSGIMGFSSFVVPAYSLFHYYAGVSVAALFWFATGLAGMFFVLSLLLLPSHIEAPAAAEGKADVEVSVAGEAEAEAAEAEAAEAEAAAAAAAAAPAGLASIAIAMADTSDAAAAQTNTCSDGNRGGEDAADAAPAVADAAAADTDKTGVEAADVDADAKAADAEADGADSDTMTSGADVEAEADADITDEPESRAQPAPLSRVARVRAALVALVPVILAPQFICLCAFFCAHWIRLTTYMGTADQQLQQLSDTAAQADHYMMLFSWITPFGFVGGPLVGLLVDATCPLVGFLVVQLVGSIHAVLALIPVLPLQVATFAIFTLQQEMLFGMIFTQMFVEFGPKGFGMPAGVLFLVGGLVGLLVPLLGTWGLRAGSFAGVNALLLATTLAATAYLVYLRCRTSKGAAAVGRSAKLGQEVGADASARSARDPEDGPGVEMVVVAEDCQTDEAVEATAEARV